MKKSIKNKWVKALRSGKYKQGKNALCQVSDKGSKGYCCLGVLTDLYIKTVKPKSGWEKRNENQLKFQDEHGFPSLDVIRWAGLNEKNPRVLIYKGKKSETLATLNDGKGYGFVRIANIIEKQL